MLDLIDVSGLYYISPIGEQYQTLGEQPEFSYFMDAMQSVLPRWLKKKYQSELLQFSIDPTVLANSIAQVYAKSKQYMDINCASVYLSNTFGTDLDFVGASRNVIRERLESDDVYRDRIRHFWTPPDSSQLQSALVTKYPAINWLVIEIPYMLNITNRSDYGVFLGRNSITIDANDSLFPLDSQLNTRQNHKAIVVYGDSKTVSQSTFLTYIQDINVLYGKYRPVGVAVYTFFVSYVS